MTDIKSHIQYIYDNAPAIHQIMQSAGVTPADIQTIDDLQKIPVTSKDKLQQMQEENPPFGGFVTVPIKKLQRIYLSPGPIYDPHGYGDDAAQEAAREAFTSAGFTDEDIVLNTFLYHMVPAGLLMDEALSTIGAAVVPTGPGNLEVQIKVILDLKVTAYVGTPSFLEMILAKAEEMGIPRLPLQKAFFSAEPYTPSQRQKFEGTYGMVTSQAYATADLGILAYEIPGKPGLYVPQNVIIQVCSPETGELLEEGQLGEVVVTSLSRTYALIRFGTGDLSILKTVTHEDGVTQKWLQGWMGRSGEAIKVRGMFLHPNALKAAAAAFPAVKQIQAIVGRDGARDTVVLHVISEGNVNTDDLLKAVKDAARLSIDSIEIVESIEGTRLIRDTRTFS
ncbi:MAG: AMP-binding protein [Anaerolineae bacterium]|nr:AMP-binding protein [Anaerolineae bacterium]